MRGNTSGYQYPQGSRPNNQPTNYGYNQPKQEYSIPPHLYVERRPSDPQSPPYRPNPNSTYNQNFSIPQGLYTDRRSSNPVPVTQPNQPQYIEPTQKTLGYQNARNVQDQATGMYHHKNPGTPSRNVNPALVVNPPPYSLSQYATFGKESLFAKKETRAEIDDSPIIDPSAFRYLNLGQPEVVNKRPSAANESGIDSRPIINLDAVTQLEKRRQQQMEKNNRVRGDDGSGSGIDKRSMVDPNAFRHIEGKKNKANEKQGQGESGIDARPITNPDAFKYVCLVFFYHQISTLNVCVLGIWKQKMHLEHRITRMNLLSIIDQSSIPMHLNISKNAQTIPREIMKEVVLIINLSLILMHLNISKNAQIVPREIMKEAVLIINLSLIPTHFVIWNNVVKHLVEMLNRALIHVQW